MAKIKRSKKLTSTGEIVLTALRKLMQNTGWTSRTIVKFIKSEYGTLEHNLGRKVHRALKRATKLGLLENESGRYRLSHLTGMIKCGSVAELRKHKRRARNRRDRMRLKFSRRE